ncbi:oxidoreductase, NAD-binding domain protein' [Rhodococcus erythropolis]|uniref:Oxidoreductase, NAD-binding domain protein n=1 Tax=Rhodococcus erythropolis TaxID=1833 RepID=A0A6G9CRW8_RHOER|nr:oxidoreductase, NAD-binding domain protein' [Rhodococcus erythropolis]
MTGISVAVAGFGWMGRVHTQAYLRLRQHYPQFPVIRLAAVADEVPGRGEEAADQFGFEAFTQDWRDIAADPAIDAVSITAPNFLHREIGVAMAEAGKHIWIEKPVGLSTEDAKAVAAAVSKAGVQSTVGFNYRNAPAVTLAKSLIDSGELGTITHSRFRFLSDYAAHPEGALSWRYERERGGAGVLGDLASHGIDLIRHLLGDVDALVADTAIFIPERARPSAATSGHARASGGEMGLSRTKTSSAHCCASARVAGAPSKHAASPWESRTITDSRFTARKVPCSGTTAGWVNWAPASARSTRTNPSRRFWSAPSPVSSAASSLARPTRWATTT